MDKKSKSGYAKFVAEKSQCGNRTGFEPVWMPGFLFDFQAALTTWALEQGRAAKFADCGLGKTPMELVWAENVVRKTNGRVLIITPLAVSNQTVREGEKFGVECKVSRDGKLDGKILVTNYERLHYFNPNDFQGVVCDESSAIKHFESERQKAVTEFMRRMPFRLLCTATAAPNDYIELGTSAEALGQMGRMDMLSTFFKNDENSNHPIWWGARWRFKPHAESNFWRWVCSWARAIQKPSDLGFSDERFVLPPLEILETVVENKQAFRGELFPVQAVTMKEQREERKMTIPARCEAAAAKVAGHDCSVLWCHLDAEGDLLEKLVNGSKQIHGGQSDEQKEEILMAFQSGEVKRLVSKPSITGWGLNWQHCAHMTTFPSHSLEQYYQSVRRFWRFGQTRKVTVDIVTTQGEMGVLKNQQRKAEALETLFRQLVAMMSDSLRIDGKENHTSKMKAPSWLK